MPNIYFLSYARPRESQPNGLDEIDRFERDLSAEVSVRIANGAGTRVGFRDTCSIEAGTHAWAQELSTQIAAHPVGIVLLSPTYLEASRPWCKWEYDFLRDRNDRAARTFDRGEPRIPRLLLTIDWVKPYEPDLPDGFPGETQRVNESIAGGDPHNVAAVRNVVKRGLRDTLKLAEADDVVRAEYRRFMVTLSQYVVDQWHRWRQHPQATAMTAVPTPFDPDNTWRFPQSTSAAAPARPRADKARQKKVFAVYFAAQPGEVPQDRAWRYRDDGEYDWQPFALTEDQSHAQAGSYLRDLADVEAKEWQFDFFGEHMREAIKRAEGKAPVLIFIDPWTVTHLPRYRGVLEQFARAELEEQVFSSPIVIWNHDDDQYQAVRAEFEREVGVLFNRHRWEPVDRPEDMSESLRDVVKSLQKKIRNAWVDRSPDSGPGLIRISASR